MDRLYAGAQSGTVAGEGVGSDRLGLGLRSGVGLGSDEGGFGFGLEVGLG